MLTMALYPNLIKEALQTVRYPGTGKDIISMEMLEDDIRIDGNSVSFSLIFEKPTDPFIKSIVKSAETAIKLKAGDDTIVTVNVKTRQAHSVLRPDACSPLCQTGSTCSAGVRLV